MQFSECVHTISMDIELRNDRIPRNPFDRQFLDMLRSIWPLLHVIMCVVIQSENSLINEAEFICGSN